MPDSVLCVRACLCHKCKRNAYMTISYTCLQSFAYCKRRMAANPMMGAYVMKNLFRS